MEVTIEPSIEHLPMPLALEVILYHLDLFSPNHHILKSTLLSYASNLLYKLESHTVKVMYCLWQNQDLKQCSLTLI